MLSLLHETFGIGILEYMENAIIIDFIFILSTGSECRRQPLLPLPPVVQCLG